MEYYISTNNEKRGPYSIEELRARGITAETLVMSTTSDTWIPAWQVAELRPIIGGNSASVEEEPTVARPVADFEDVGDAPYQSSTNYQQGTPVPPPSHDDGNKKGNGCLKGFLITLICLLAIVGIAISTCPDEAAHKAALTDVVAQAASDEINDSDSNGSDDGIIDRLFQQMGSSLIVGVARNAVNNLVHVDNHIVFSTGKLRLGDKEHIVSVGVFGHVFTVDKDDLKTAAERYYTRAGQDIKSQLQQKTTEIIQQKVVDPAIDAVDKEVKETIKDFLNEFGISMGQDNGDDDAQQSDSTSEDF